MNSIIGLISDLDDAIISGIVGFVALIGLLKWMVEKLKTQKTPLHTLQNDAVRTQLNNYTFNFEAAELSSKPFGMRTKIISAVLAFVIILMPLYEIIETLQPREAISFWGMCLPY